MAFKLKDSHWEVIISFMEENKSIATGRFIGPNGKENNKKLWQELAQQLNALGQGERSVEKWQKVRMNERLLRYCSVVLIFKLRDLFYFSDMDRLQISFKKEGYSFGCRPAGYRRRAFKQCSVEQIREEGSCNSRGYIF